MVVLNVCFDGCKVALSKYRLSAEYIGVDTSKYILVLTCIYWYIGILVYVGIGIYIGVDIYINVGVGTST